MFPSSKSISPRRNYSSCTVRIEQGEASSKQASKQTKPFARTGRNAKVSWLFYSPSTVWKLVDDPLDLTQEDLKHIRVEHAGRHMERCALSVMTMPERACERNRAAVKQLAQSISLKHKMHISHPHSCQPDCIPTWNCVVFGIFEDVLKSASRRNHLLRSRVSRSDRNPK